MNLIDGSIERAVLASHARLQQTAQAAAAGGSGRSAETLMAASAQEALFNEALLGAAKAQFEEIKTVTK